MEQAQQRGAAQLHALDAAEPTPHRRASPGGEVPEAGEEEAVARGGGERARLPVAPQAPQSPRELRLERQALVDVPLLDRLVPGWPAIRSLEPNPRRRQPVLCAEPRFRPD